MILNWLSLAVYGYLLGAIVASDYKYLKIPNKLVFPGMALAILFNVLQGTWQSSLIGGFVVLAMFIASRVITKVSLGSGDYLLAMFIGFMLGFPMGLWAVFAGVVAGGIVDIILACQGKIKLSINFRKQQYKATGQKVWYGVFLGVSAGVFLLAGVLS